MDPLQADDPRRVGAYRLLSRLGSGGMGTVYLGHLPAGLPVAIKLVHTEIAEALVGIHRAGVVHRDLKPANVMLAPDSPRLIDFGIAHAADAAVVVTGGAVTVATVSRKRPEAPASPTHQYGHRVRGRGRHRAGALAAHAQLVRAAPAPDRDAAGDLRRHSLRRDGWQSPVRPGCRGRE